VPGDQAIGRKLFFRFIVHCGFSCRICVRHASARECTAVSHFSLYHILFPSATQGMPPGSSLVKNKRISKSLLHSRRKHGKLSAGFNLNIF
jgi:hypothetical protein